MGYSLGYLINLNYGLKFCNIIYSFVIFVYQGKTDVVKQWENMDMQ